MAEGKKAADADRPLAVLHKLAGDVVDGRDVVGVHRMTQAKAVSQECRTKQYRLVAEYQQGPGPDPDIREHQQCIDTRDPPSQIGGTPG